MTFARWGLPTLLWTTFVLAWGLYLLPGATARWCAAPVAAFLWLFTLAFFRNPARTPQGGESCLCAPADGVVSDIGEVDEKEFLNCRCLRIGIFLSVFDVHVNRSPIAGTVVAASYRPGKFLDARHPDVSHANEANNLAITVDPALIKDLTVVVRQLSGLIARRIICTHGVGDRLARGELFGMIKFGSRTEVWIPLARAGKPAVAVGEKVRCGETLLMDLAQLDTAPARSGPV